MPINFTVEFAMFGNEADTDDTGLDVDRIPLVGDAVFEPVLRNHNPIMAPDYDPPAGFVIRTVKGYINSDGILRASPSGPEGVRLWANDPVFGLDSLTYRVTFNLTTPLGQPVRVDGGYFAAPYDDRVINLVDVLQSNSSLGGPRIVAGEFADGAVVFENEDGSFVQAIEIPEGTVVFTDNGDGTWSAG